MKVKELKEYLIDEMQVALTAPFEITRRLDAATLKEVKTYDEEDIDHIAISRDKKECVLSLGLTRALIVRWSKPYDFRLCDYFKSQDEPEWHYVSSGLNKIFNVNDAFNICRKLRESSIQRRDGYMYMVMKWIPGLTDTDVSYAIDYTLNIDKKNRLYTHTDFGLSEKELDDLGKYVRNRRA